MFETSQLILFFSASLALLLMPGPAVLYISAQSIERGARYGCASAAGVAIGGLVHVAAAVFGLSAILATSATAFNAIKYLGAAYLIFLGVAKLLEKRSLEARPIVKRVSLNRVFRQGVIVEILNPKVALFFLSFLPQFVRPEVGSATMQIAVLGLSYVALAFFTDSSYAFVTAKFSKLLSRQLTGSVHAKWFSGCTYIGLGVLTAATGNRKTAA